MIISELINSGAIYAFAGAFTGLLAGILGIGGGMIVVPCLLFIFHHNGVIPDELLMHTAAGTSLAIMILTAQSAIRHHLKKGELLWSVYFKLLPGIIAGVVAGGVFADLLPTDWLRVLFGLFLLFVAWKMYSDIHVQRAEKQPPLWLNTLASFIIGFKSGLLGVGGGALIIPWLTYNGIDMRKVTAISALCTFTVAIIGTITFIFTGWHESGLPSWSSGYVYWPAVLWVAIPSSYFAGIGVKLTYVLPVKQLKYGFIVILLITAIDMLF